MPKATHYIPAGYHAVTPYLIVHNAAQAIEFYKNALGATEIMRMPDPQTGKIGHAELKFGDCHIMLADEHPTMGFRSPQTLKGSPIGLMLYVENVDALMDRAVSAGAKITQPIQDQFYGDRSGQIEDPFGHTWTVATHTEDVTPQEMEKRVKEWSEQNKPK